ncbi:MAG: type II toxin-antitoxin system prevent-host-death family antitoxin [Clostridia bacterium]|nr:type II toxin-antitoxin system prevent-host-death family antitoxin [Clostridia bacterium]
MSRVVGIREAKTRLSRIVQDVRQGGEWVITQRGRPVARLVPVDGPSRALGDRIRALEERGWIVRPPKGARVPVPVPVKTPGIAQRFLQEDREG